ncbi:translation initiation factor IF-2-like [Serinus canaria]|uniref:translation initiation factor IF-2-like n=1 Tax=Serinus canaria TaxID=9135 RepID=UPI0021CC6FE7|nr:translation initiation factor IF-2-like [Serinus canaria]
MLLKAPTATRALQQQPPLAKPHPGLRQPRGTLQTPLRAAIVAQPPLGGRFNAAGSGSTADTACLPRFTRLRGDALGKHRSTTGAPRTPPAPRQRPLPAVGPRPDHPPRPGRSPGPAAAWARRPSPGGPGPAAARGAPRAGLTETAAGRAGPCRAGAAGTERERPVLRGAGGRKGRRRPRTSAAPAAAPPRVKGTGTAPAGSPRHRPALPGTDRGRSPAAGEPRERGVPARLCHVCGCITRSPPCAGGSPPELPTWGSLTSS